jgi:hypothetical protein
MPSGRTGDFQDFLLDFHLLATRLAKKNDTRENDNDTTLWTSTDIIHKNQ